MELQLDTIASRVFLVDTSNVASSPLVIKTQNQGLSEWNYAAVLWTQIDWDESWLELLHIENQSGHKNYPSQHPLGGGYSILIPACSCPGYNSPLTLMISSR